MMSLWDALRMNMMISYQELVRTFPKERALQELSRHCVPETDFEEFFSDMGVKEQYDAQEVLLWLGY
ncbi:TPA: hypothetical protein ONC17_004277 [Enterobacter kobei]|nr:hypothetical protein [Enterobacter kobei]